jgi:dTDP-4-amino-4,6-dideoxygalactose transaminase
MTAASTAAVPFIDLRAQFAEVKDDVMRAVERVFDSQGFILGPTVEAFERDLAAYLGLPAAGVIGCSSGTDALLMALMALGIGPGDRVLTTPFSFFATAGVISRLHARVELADIEHDSMNLDPRKLEALDARRYKAIIVVDLFGRAADVATIRAWADPAGVAVVEDACQAIGARDAAGQPCGALGTIGCFSFFPTKNLGAAGDAGCVTTRDPQLAEALRVLRVHGAPVQYHSQVIGGNFRLDAVQAAVLHAKLPRLDAWTAKRLENARLYNRLFTERGLAEDVRTPDVPGDGTFIAHQYVIRATRRDALKKHLDAHGIGSAVYYPVPFHLMQAFASLGYRAGDFPEAEAAAREVLALPIFPELGAERLERVVDAVADFYRGA